MCLVPESASLKSMIVRVPQVVKSGDTVTLSCEYDLEQVPLYSVKWYRNDIEFYRFIPKESPPFKAFAVKFVNVDVSIFNLVLGLVHLVSSHWVAEVWRNDPVTHQINMWSKLSHSNLYLLYNSERNGVINNSDRIARSFYELQGSLKESYAPDNRYDWCIAWDRPK